MAESSTFSRSRALAALLGMGALVALYSCTSESPDPVQPDANPEAQSKPPDSPQDTLVIAEITNFDGIISPIMQSASDSRLADNITFSPTNPTFDCELTHKPGLYESFSFSEDHTVLRVQIRQGIQWDDGTPVTAQDIKFTYDLIADPDVASPRHAYIERMVKGKAPLVIDDYNLEFHYLAAYDEPTMLSHAAFPPVQKSRLENADRRSLRGNPYGQSPSISGPWKIESWEQGSKVVLAPNDKFTGPAEQMPKLKRVIVKVVPEYSTRIVELENGSVDLVGNVLVADADRLAKTHPELKFYRRGWRSADYLGWNNFDPADYKAKKSKAGESLDWSTVKAHPIFGDRAVRRALSKAVNVDKIIADLMTSKVTGEVYARRAVSNVTPALCSWHNNDIKPMPYEPSTAKAELEALGWRDTNNDGVLDKDGRDLRFKLMIGAGNQRRNDAAIIIQANLKEIGVVAEIEQVEFNNFVERMRNKDFEAALGGWSAALFVDMNSTWHSGERYEFNQVGYSNPEVDRLIEGAVQERDSAKAAAMTKEAQALIFEDQPFTFLYWMDEIVALHARFRDAQIDILSPWRDLNTWWVPTDQVKYPN